jgi:hypothetical protein
MSPMSGTKRRHLQSLTIGLFTPRNTSQVNRSIQDRLTPEVVRINWN